MKLLLLADNIINTKEVSSKLLHLVDDLGQLIDANQIQIPVSVLIGQAPSVVIAYRYYNQCKSLIAQCLFRKASNPDFHIYTLIGDVRRCANGFIEVETFDDVQSFGDMNIERSVQRGLDDIYYRTRQLLQSEPCKSLFKSCDKNIDKLHATLDSLLTDCRTYDIEVTTQLVPYLKSNVWHSDYDYQKKTGVDKTFCTVHTEERFAYSYQVTLLDKLLAYTQLSFYQQVNLTPLHRVYSNGNDYIVRPNADYDDTFKPTPIYVDTTEEHEDLNIREYVVPKSACGQLRKVNEYYFNPYTDGNNL